MNRFDKRFPYLFLLVFSIFATLISCEDFVSTYKQGPALREVPPNPDAVFADPDWAVIDPPDDVSYQFIINDVTYDMYAQYVDACIEQGFTDVTCQTETTYQAYTEKRDYWISVSLYAPHADMDPTKYIYIGVWEAEEVYVFEME